MFVTFKQHFLFVYLARVGYEILFPSYLFYHGDNGNSEVMRMLFHFLLSAVFVCIKKHFLLISEPLEGTGIISLDSCMSRYCCQ